MKIQWIDITSYDKYDKVRVPTTFSIRCGKLGIIVTNSHIYHRPDWVVHCFALGIDSQIMKDVKSLDDAKARAINIVAVRMDEMRDAFIEIKRC